MAADTDAVLRGMADAEALALGAADAHGGALGGIEPSLSFASLAALNGLDGDETLALLNPSLTAARARSPTSSPPSSCSPRALATRAARWRSATRSSPTRTMPSLRRRRLLREEALNRSCSAAERSPSYSPRGDAT